LPAEGKEEAKAFACSH